MQQIDVSKLLQLIGEIGAVGLFIVSAIFAWLLMLLPYFVYGIWKASRRSADALERLEHKLRK
jgi:hypothetical protein